MKIKEKVKSIISTMEVSFEDKGFDYFEDMMISNFSNDPDFSIIKEKMDNLVNLLTTKQSESQKSFEDFLDLDFEDEIWYMI